MFAVNGRAAKLTEQLMSLPVREKNARCRDGEVRVARQRGHGSRARTICRPRCSRLRAALSVLVGTTRRAVCLMNGCWNHLRPADNAASPNHVVRRSAGWHCPLWTG